MFKGRAHCATVRSVLLYRCEIRSMRDGNARRLEVFDYRCLRSISKIGSIFLPRLWNLPTKTEIDAVVFSSEREALRLIFSQDEFRGFWAPSQAWSFSRSALGIGQVDSVGMSVRRINKYEHVHIPLGDDRPRFRFNLEWPSVCATGYYHSASDVFC